MKGLTTVLRVKKRELSDEERRLKELLTKREELKLRERETQERLNSLKSLSVKNPFELGIWKETGRALLKELERLRAEMELLQEQLEKQKEKVAVKRGEVKAVEKFIEKRVREKERREELLLERFIHEVLGSRYTD